MCVCALRVEIKITVASEGKFLRETCTQENPLLQHLIVVRPQTGRLELTHVWEHGKTHAVWDMARTPEL